MALDQAWAVGGGAENPIEGARLATYAATNGGRGVILPGDMKVSALPTPGPFVRVVSGACASPNDYLGVNGGGQSYSGREASSTDVPVAPTGSSGGQVKYLIWAIHDEQYERGLTPADPVNDPRNNYEWVSSINGLTFPHVPLVRLEQPADTATITGGMLTDIREVADPKEKTVIRARQLDNIDTETLTVTLEKGEFFPNAGGQQSIKIPLYATRAIIEAAWNQVDEPAGNALGGCWVEFGPYVEQSVRQYTTHHSRWNTNGNPDNAARGNWFISEDVYIPKEIRGTTQVFVMKARITGTSSNAARPRLDNLSSVKLKVTFQQIADQSTT